MLKVRNNSLLTIAVALFAAALGFYVASVSAQKVVDKTVATVSDGLRTELITLSDLRWQIALQPGAKLNPPSSEDLNAVLQKLIDQRIFSLEANRLPRNPVSEKEVADEIKRLMSYFATPAEFESRLREVGFASVSDENFQRIISDRVAIEKFLDFRFESFIVVTAKDEETYYRNVFVPDFRRRFPGLLMPTLDEKRVEINRTLVVERVGADMEAFLESAKQRMTITIVSPV